MNVEKIYEFNEKGNGVPNGDSCEECGTEKHPLYHLEKQNVGIDIILCPQCIGRLKSDLDKIQL